MEGTVGFEPTTSWTRTRRYYQLSYVPTNVPPGIHLALNRPTVGPSPFRVAGVEPASAE